MLQGSFEARLLNGTDSRIAKIRKSGEEINADKLQRRYDFAKLCRAVAPDAQEGLDDAAMTDTMNEMLRHQLFDKEVKILPSQLWMAQARRRCGVFLKHGQRDHVFSCMKPWIIDTERMSCAVPLWAHIVDQCQDARLQYGEYEDSSISAMSTQYQESMLNDELIRLIKYSPVAHTKELAQHFVLAQKKAISGPSPIDLAEVPELLITAWDNIMDLMSFLCNLAVPEPAFGGTDPRSSVQFLDRSTRDESAEDVVDAAWETFKDDVMDALATNAGWKVLVDSWKAGQWKLDAEYGPVVQDIVSKLEALQDQEPSLPVSDAARHVFTKMKDEWPTLNPNSRPCGLDALAKAGGTWAKATAKLLAAVDVQDSAACDSVRADADLVREVAAAVGVATDKEMVRCLQSLEEILAAFQSLTFKNKLSTCREVTDKELSSEPACTTLQEILENIEWKSLSNEDIEMIYEMRQFLYKAISLAVTGGSVTSLKSLDPQMKLLQRVLRMEGSGEVAALRAQELNVVTGILKAALAVARGSSELDTLQIGTPLNDKSGKVMTFALALQAWQASTEVSAFKNSDSDFSLAGGVSHGYWIQEVVAHFDKMHDESAKKLTAVSTDLQQSYESELGKLLKELEEYCKGGTWKKDIPPDSEWAPTVEKIAKTKLLGQGFNENEANKKAKIVDDMWMSYAGHMKLLGVAQALPTESYVSCKQLFECHLFEYKIANAELAVLGSSKKKRQRQAALQILKKRNASVSESDVLPCMLKLAHK